MALQFGTKFWEAMKDGAPGSNTGTPFSERYFNPIWRLIDARLGGLEDVKAGWVEATDTLNELGLQRLEQVLGPAFARLGKIADLGFLIAHSSTEETLVVDEISTFVIADLNERELFHPSVWVTITKPDSASDYALGRVASYVRATGILDVEIKQIVGSPGPHADWEIIAGSGVTLLVETMVDDAQAARDLSKAWAERANNTDVSGAGTRSAKHHASVAGGFATEAKDARDQVNAAAIIVSGGPVSSVNGKTGTAVLSASDVGAYPASTGEAFKSEYDTHTHDGRYYTESEVDTALGDKLDKSGGTISGTVNHADNAVQRPHFVDISETVNALGSGSGARTINLELGNVVTATAAGATTWTFSNPPATGRSGTFTLRLTNGGSAAQTWPASVKPAGGTAPALSAAGRDRLVFTTEDAGATWDMVLAGKDFK